MMLSACLLSCSSLFRSSPKIFRATSPRVPVMVSSIRICMGLRKFIGHVRDPLQSLLQPVREFLLLLSAGVLHLLGERDVGIGFIFAHGFSGKIGAAELRDHALNLSKTLDRPFNLIPDSK